MSAKQRAKTKHRFAKDGSHIGEGSEDPCLNCGMKRKEACRPGRFLPCKPVDYSDPPFFSEQHGWTGMFRTADIEREKKRVCPIQPCNCRRCALLNAQLRQLRTEARYD